MSMMSVSDLAAARNKSKQAISKQIARLGDRVPTRKEGVRLMVDVEAFDRVTGAETDPAQALRNRSVTANAGQNRDARISAADDFSANRAKREGYDAELSRLSLAQKMGQLVDLRSVEDAMVRVATALLQKVEQLPAQTENAEARAVLKRLAADFRDVLHREMRILRDEAEEEAEAS